LQLQYSEVEEGQVRDPHDAVDIDIFESPLHEVANVVEVLPQSGTRHAATVIVFFQQQHQKVGSSEADHDDEDGQVCLQE